MMESQIYMKIVRLLYYLPMERMKNFKDEVDRLVWEYIVELEQENKNLKLIQETNEKQIQNDIKERDELREENKNLKDDLLHYIRREEEYREKIQTLELWLDNKEKLNEEYRREIDKLKSDLSECECSFWFEADESWFWKRECKELRKWIKEHVDYQTQADFRKRFEHK